MAIDATLKLGDIKGESVKADHAGEIDVLAWSWGMSQSGTTHTGTGGGAGKVNVQDLSFTKYLDKSTSPIIVACCKGTHIPEAMLSLRKAGGTALDYLKIKLETVLITAVSTGGSAGEDRLTENVTLNFGKFSVFYQPQNAQGGKDGGSIDAIWNIALGK